MITGIYLILAFVISGMVFINRRTKMNYILTGLFAGLQAGFTVYACYKHTGTELGYFTFDSLGLLLLITLTIITFPAIFHSHLYIERHKGTFQSRSIYFAALIILITSITAGYLSNHIAVIWIFTELTTLSASALIYHHRNKLALEGTWKYVFICAVSISFVFIGILFLGLSLRNTGSGDLSFTNLLIYKDRLDPFWLRLAFLFIFTGFTAKLGLVPMYTAGIDAKDKAPAPAGALLASVLMNLGFAGIFRLYSVIAHTGLHTWINTIIIVSAFLSVLVATVYMSRVQNIKRMLAYSGIEHMGIVMLGVAAGGPGYYAAVLHVVLHAFVKSSMFFQYNQLYNVFNSKRIADTGNYFRYNPAGAIVLLAGFLSVVAIPPSGLFVSELLVFKALLEGEHILILASILLFLTIIIYAFGKNIMKILFVPVTGFDDSRVLAVSQWESVPQYILLALAVWLGLNPPDTLVALIEDAVNVLPL